MPSPIWRPRLALVLGLALVMVTSMWGPIAPGVHASQFHDSGTDDPRDVEGVDEPPWRAWETTSIQGGTGHPDIATGPDNGAYVTWGLGEAWLAYPTEDPRPGQRFKTTQLDGNERSVRGGGVAVQEDGRIWVAYAADAFGTLAREIYLGTATDPEGDWTRYRLADKGWHPRVAIDDAGTVHVVYEGDDVTLRHATYTPEAGWEQENITTIEPSGTRDLDLAVEAGRIHLAWGERVFEKPSPAPASYAVKDIGESGWTVEGIPDLPAYCPGEPDVGAAPDGSAWIACRGDGGITAWHRAVNGTWSQEQIANGAELVPPRHRHDLGGGTSVAVDEEGVAHVVFRTRAPLFFKNDVTRPGNPQYAARVDGDWTVETIDRTAQVNGRNPTITVDDNGHPHAAYMLWSRIDPFPPHPCPGCGMVNDQFEMHHARPLAATVDGALP